jgi:hypothetical protein
MGIIKDSLTFDDESLENSKSASNIIRFFYLGFMYILRIIVTLVRRRN